jgi:ATP-dependent Lhr-like helicase
MNELVEAGRAVRVEDLWVAAERRAEAELPDVRELVRGRLGIVGPTSAAALAATIGVPESEVDAALVALESEGVVLRGRFSPRDAEAPAELEWCERRLLARIHRYTLNRLRAEIEPVSPADFMRFLFAWQRLDSEHRAAGLEGLASVVEQLDGFEVPAAAWESDVLAARVEEYDPALLDTLSLTGRVRWAAGRRGGGTAPPIRSTPIALFAREHAGDRPVQSPELSTYGARVREVLERRGASFFHELAPLSGLLPTQVEQALGELAGLGLVTSDSFAGLRALITPSSKRKPLGGGRRRHRTAPFGIESAGRWWTEARKSRSSSPRGCCSVATAWCSNGCCLGRRVPHCGASWFRRIGAWRAGERFAAGGSSPACRASSSRFRKRWVSSAQCVASRLRDDWLRSAPRTRST